MGGVARATLDSHRRRQTRLRPHKSLITRPRSLRCLRRLGTSLAFLSLQHLRSITMAAGASISSNWKSSRNTPSHPRGSESDEKLVVAAKRGERVAFDELFKRHAQNVYRTTYRITRNREDAEDAVQDCFLNAFVHLKSFDGRAQFATWLTRIAMNAALMRLRKNRTAREVPLDQS